MAGTDITRLMNNLRISLPGAVDDAIKIEIYNALNQFFQDSNIWREDIPLPVTAGEKEYELLPTGPVNIVRVMSIWDGNLLPVAGALDLTTQNLVLATAPGTDGIYTVQVALTVNDPTDREGYPVFPDWILNLYMNDMIGGVLGRMMAQPAKPYSNASLAAYHTRAFAAAIATARIEANRRYVYGAQRWRFPQTFNRYKRR